MINKNNKLIPENWDDIIELSKKGYEVVLDNYEGILNKEQVDDGKN